MSWLGWPTRNCIARVQFPTKESARPLVFVLAQQCLVVVAPFQVYLAPTALMFPQAFFAWVLHFILAFSLSRTLIISETDTIFRYICGLFFLLPGEGTWTIHLRSYQGGSPDPCGHIWPRCELLLHLLFNFGGIVLSQVPTIS